MELLIGFACAIFIFVVGWRFGFIAGAHAACDALEQVMRASRPQVRDLFPEDRK